MNRYQFPLYPVELGAVDPFLAAAMDQQAEQEAIFGSLEIFGAGPGTELDRLLAMSGAAAYGEDMYAGTEIVGDDVSGAAAYGDPDAAYGDEYAGYGEEVYSGALPSRAAYPRWMQQRGRMVAPPGRPAAPARPAPAGPRPVSFGRGVSVTEKMGTHVRRQILPMATPGVVTALGGTAVASALPQIPFRPERLVVPSDFGGTFDITDVKVGKDSQFVAPGAVPARMFDEKSVDNLLSFHAAAVSQIVSVQVVNNGGVGQVFRCAMVGTSIE